MAKKHDGPVIKLKIGAGAANPAPPIGPALGQHGLNIKQFCDQFNARTAKFEKGLPHSVVIYVGAKKDFTFDIKSPPTSVLILKVLGIKKGSMKPGADIICKITRAQAKEVAEIKLKDSNAFTLESMIVSVLGTARSMGIEVQEEEG